MSRPASDISRVFADRPVAVMGATPGMGGTTLAQSAWLPVLRTLQMRPWFGGRLLVSNARQTFDGDGNLTDEKIRGQLKVFVAGFESFIRKS
jgi:chromate reductase, NAD(P)H dehydrogenase (quinone)